MTASQARQESRAGALPPEQGGGYEENRKGKPSNLPLLPLMVACTGLHTPRRF